MPIFEYRCSVCEHVFERLVLGAASVPCPQCGSERLERLMSTSSVSSDQTRKDSSKDLRARNRLIRQDQAVEEVRRLESHASDHDQ